jgi:hypothetical protein
LKMWPAHGPQSLAVTRGLISEPGRWARRVWAGAEGHTKHGCEQQVWPIAGQPQGRERGEQESVAVAQAAAAVYRAR